MNEERQNTKLHLTYSQNADDLPYHSGKVANFMGLYIKLGYQFPLTPLPIVSMKVKEVERTYVNMFKREKKYKDMEAVYYLEFPRELTDAELDFWRMFKLGYLCHYCSGVGR